MSWNAEHNPALRIVELVLTGPTTARDLQEATSKGIALGKETGVKHFLVDTGEVKLLASLLDVIDLPNKQYVAEKADRLWRVAVVQPRSPQEQETMRFYETVCRNRGWTVRVLATRPEALDWLLGSDP